MTKLNTLDSTLSGEVKTSTILKKIDSKTKIPLYTMQISYFFLQKIIMQCINLCHIWIMYAPRGFLFEVNTSKTNFKQFKANVFPST